MLLFEVDYDDDGPGELTDLSVGSLLLLETGATTGGADLSVT
jgi:hypothetical protein